MYFISFNVLCLYTNIFNARVSCKVDNGSNTDTKILYLEICEGWWSIQASCGLEPFMKRYFFFFSSLFGSLHSARLIFSSLTTSASPLSSSPPAELSNNTVLPAIILRAVFCLNAFYEKQKKKRKNGRRRWNKNVGGVYPKDDPSHVSFFLNSFYHYPLGYIFYNSCRRKYSRFVASCVALLSCFVEFT